MDELSVLAMAAIIIEMSWRVRFCGIDVYSLIYHSLNPSTFLIISYIICIIVAILDLKHVTSLQSMPVRNMLSFLHSIDSLTAATLGIGIYCQREDLCLLSIAATTKLGLLSFVTRMITGKQSKTKLDAVLETTRAYLHHVGSFLFLNSNKFSLLIGSWRCLTLLGHALVASKIKSENPSDKQAYEFKIQMIAYLRQFLLFLMIVSCMVSPYLRRGFGKQCFIVLIDIYYIHCYIFAWYT